MFDVKAFLEAPVAGANATKRELAPVGEFIGIIEKIDGASGTIKNGDRIGEPWARLDVRIKCDDPMFVEGGLTGITHGVMLDLVNGNLDMGKGKNISLGRLREATGTNSDGPFSFQQLVGRPLRFKVEHEPAKDKPGEVYDRVTAVSKV